MMSSQRALVASSRATSDRNTTAENTKSMIATRTLRFALLGLLEGSRRANATVAVRMVSLKSDMKVWGRAFYVGILYLLNPKANMFGRVLEA